MLAEPDADRKPQRAAVTTASRAWNQALLLWLQHAFAALRIIRMPLLISMVGALFLTQPGQTLEFYRLLMDGAQVQINQKIRWDERTRWALQSQAAGIEESAAHEAAMQRQAAAVAQSPFRDLPRILLSREFIFSRAGTHILIALGGLLLLVFSIRHMTRRVTRGLGGLEWVPRHSWSVWLVKVFGPALLATLLLFAAASGLKGSAPSDALLVKMLKSFEAAGAAPGLHEFTNWVDTFKDLHTLHDLAGMTCLAIGLLLLPLFVLLDWHAGAGAAVPACGGERRIGRNVLVGCIVLSALIVATMPGELSQSIGALPVFCVFLSALALVIGRLTVWSGRTGVPIITPLLLAAVVFSYFDLNDNHSIRRLGPGGSAIETNAAMTVDQALPEASSEFLKWFESRADLDDYRPGGAMYPKPYPVYVVAAQGGGIYAAVHALETMSRFQMSCPAFAQHLFAISSVSGGSVGSAVFASLAKTFAHNKRISCQEFPLRPTDTSVKTPYVQNFEAQKQKFDEKWSGQFEVLGKFGTRDFMSPLLSALLFPDFLQRFLPFSVPQFSRARAIESGFEKSWDAAFAYESKKDKQDVDAFIWAWGLDPKLVGPGSGGKLSNPLTRGFLETWDSATAVPALLMNTTEPYSGRRRIIAPFTFATGPEHPGSDLRFMPISRDNDLPLSTAASLSARFPWASPSGWFNEAVIGDDGKRGERKVRLVDGGYVDNSGVATALDLIKSLDEAIEARKDRFAALPKLEVHLISLLTGSFAEGTFHGLGEGLAPMQAMLNSRTARTYATVENAAQQLRASRDDPAAPREIDCRTSARMSVPGRVATRLHRVSVEGEFFDLPLGWRLSPFTRYMVQRQAGDPFDCMQDAAIECAILKSGSRPDGDCVQSTILRMLTEKPQPPVP